ncbi:PAS domain S-box protein [Aurantibacillus circumpalustris]|uniref:PAS domain S-box protein n=1 Tax=Aurantibacillus circumpalustris TaxID=3036359 RepID=UPI00295A7607|nr:PAS domain S-box protein [Aurantibacillus circumpalustris]
MKKTHTILLLESDDYTVRRINESLGNFGYSITRHDPKNTIISSVIAIKPDLILMGVIAGEEAKICETAQLIYDNYKIPVVFLSTFTSKTIIEKSKRCNLLGFVFKPLVEKDLIATVELTLFQCEMEKKLSDAERKYTELSDSIFQTVIECDLSGKIISTNRFGLEMFGITESDMATGVSLLDFVKENKDGSILDVSKRSSFIDLNSLNREFPLINKKGKKYIIEELLTPIFVNYKLSGYRGILIDITNKRLKQNLCCVFKELSYKYDQVCAETTEICSFVEKEVQDLLPNLKVSFYNNTRSNEATTKESTLEINENPLYRTFVKDVLESNTAKFLSGDEFNILSCNTEFKDEVSRNSCFVGFPIGSKTSATGLFVIGSFTNRNALSLGDYEKLSDFFESLNLFLEKNSYLKELKRSENLFKSLVNTINEGLIKIELDSTISFANNRLTEMSGYTHNDIIGKKAFDFLGSNHVNLFKNILEYRKRGISNQYELVIKTKEGNLKKFFVNGAPFRDENGAIIGALGTFKEVVSKKESFDLLASTETLLNEIAGTISVAFWIYSFETKRIQYLSPAFSKIFEVETNDIYKTNSLREFIHPNDQRTVLKRNQTNLSTGEFEIKYRIITPGGKIKWVQDKSVLVKDPNGKVIKMIGYVQEITKLKLTEEKLLKSETEKNNIIKSIPDSYLLLGNNDEVVDSFLKPAEKGFLPLKSKRIHSERVSRIFQEGVAKVISENRNLCHNSTDATIFELEIPLNDQINWYEIRMTAVNPEKVLMIIRNITASKNTINSIQKIFNITEQTQELIMITDSSGIIEYVNPMFTQVTGYAANEIIGSNSNVLRSKKHNKTFYSNMWNTLKMGKVFKGDLHNTKKSGELFIEEKIITPYLDRNGEITNFISMGRDVTVERKSDLNKRKRRYLERALALKNQKNRTLSLIRGHENERKRFGREIHEGLNQMLSAAMINLESIKESKLMDGEQKNKIDFVNKMVAEIMQELRGISSNLSPVSLFEFGLHAVIQQTVKRLNAQYSDINVSFKSNVAGMRFTEEIEINFYRTIQEAILNALKHSKAKNIHITLNFNKNKLIFLMKDNGVGINKREFETKKKKSFGISSIEERACVIGAQLEFCTNKNKGFEINMAVNAKKINL